jgi:hypothetical protein
LRLRPRPIKINLERHLNRKSPSATNRESVNPRETRKEIDQESRVVRGRKKDGLGEEEKSTDNTRLGFLTKQWNRRQKAGGNPRIGGDGARVDGKSEAAAVARERGAAGGLDLDGVLGWGGGSAPLSSSRGLRGLPQRREVGLPQPGGTGVEGDGAGARGGFGEASLRWI